MNAHFTTCTWAENIFSFPQCSGDCSSLCPQDRPNLLWTMDGKCQLQSSVVSPMIPTRPLSKGAGGRAGREVKEGFLEEGKRAEQEGDTARWALTRHKQLGILGAPSPGQAVPRGRGARRHALPCPRRGAGNLMAEHLCPRGCWLCTVSGFPARWQLLPDSAGPLFLAETYKKKNHGFVLAACLKVSCAAPLLPLTL